MIVFRIANGLVALLFVLAVAVQYNDPDPLLWITIYFFSLAACVAWETGWLHPLAALPLAAVGAAWGVYSGLNTTLTVPLGEALMDWKMTAGGAEELRETLGLGIVALWMAALTVVQRSS